MHDVSVCLFVCCDVTSGPGQAFVEEVCVGETWPSEIWLFRVQRARGG